MKFFKRIIVLLLTIMSVSVYGQNLPPFTSLDSDTLTWTDYRGINLLLLEQSDLFTDENGLSSIKINVTHWFEKDRKLLKNWSFEDEIQDCPVDAEAKFLVAPRFSDINDDGIYEIWFITQKSCKGDVSPSLVQVVMVDEKNVKYFMDAEEKLIFPDGNSDSGSYTLGDFAELSQSYQDFALSYLFNNYVYMFIER